MFRAVALMARRGLHTRRQAQHAVLEMMRLRWQAALFLRLIDEEDSDDKEMGETGLVLSLRGMVRCRRIYCLLTQPTPKLHGHWPLALHQGSIPFETRFRFTRAEFEGLFTFIKQQIPMFRGNGLHPGVGCVAVIGVRVGVSATGVHCGTPPAPSALLPAMPPGAAAAAATAIALRT